MNILRSVYSFFSGLNRNINRLNNITDRFVDTGNLQLLNEIKTQQDYLLTYEEYEAYEAVRQSKGKIRGKIKNLRTQIFNSLKVTRQQIRQEFTAWERVHQNVPDIQEFFDTYRDRADVLRREAEGLLLIAIALDHEAPDYAKREGWLDSIRTSYNKTINLLKFPIHAQFDNRGVPIQRLPIVNNKHGRNLVGNQYISNRFYDNLYIYDNINTYTQLLGIMRYEYQRFKETVNNPATTNNPGRAARVVNLVLRFIERGTGDIRYFFINPRFITSDLPFWSDPRTFNYAIERRYDHRQFNSIINQPMIITAQGEAPNPAYDLTQLPQLYNGYLTDIPLVNTASDNIDENWDLDLSYFKFENGFVRIFAQGKSENMIYETHNIVSDGRCVYECLNICKYPTEEPELNDVDTFINHIKINKLPIAILDNNFMVRRGTFGNERLTWELVKPVYFYQPEEIEHYLCYDNHHMDVCKLEQLACGKYVPIINSKVTLDKYWNVYKDKKLIHKRLWTEEEEKKLSKHSDGMEKIYLGFDINTVSDIYDSLIHKPYSLSISGSNYDRVFIGYDCVYQFLNWLKEEEEKFLYPTKFVLIGYRNTELANRILYETISEEVSHRNIYVINTQWYKGGILNMFINGKHSMFDTHNHINSPLKDICKSFKLDYVPSINLDVQKLYNSDGLNFQQPYNYNDLSIIERIIENGKSYSKLYYDIFMGYKDRLNQIPQLKKYADNLGYYVTLPKAAFTVEKDHFRQIDAISLGLSWKKNPKCPVTDEERAERKEKGLKHQDAKTKTTFQPFMPVIPLQVIEQQQACNLGGIINQFNDPQKIIEHVMGIDRSGAYTHAMTADGYFPISNATFKLMSLDEYTEKEGRYLLKDIDQSNLWKRKMTNIIPIKSFDGNSWDHRQIVKLFWVGNDIVKDLLFFQVKFEMIVGCYTEERILGTHLFKPFIELNQIKNNTTDEVMRKILKLFCLAPSGVLNQRPHTNKISVFNTESSYYKFCKVTKEEDINMSSHYGRIHYVNHKVDPNLKSMKWPLIGMAIYDKNRSFMYRYGYYLAAMIPRNNFIYGDDPYSEYYKEYTRNAEVDFGRIINTNTDSIGATKQVIDDWIRLVQHIDLPHSTKAEQFEPRYITAKLFDKNKTKICGAFCIEFTSEGVENPESYFLGNNFSLVTLKDGFRIKLSGIDKERSILLNNDDYINIANPISCSNFMINNQHRTIEKKPLEFFRRAFKSYVDNRREFANPELLWKCEMIRIFTYIFSKDIVKTQDHYMIKILNIFHNEQIKLHQENENI